MENIKISFIVPVFNSAKYLKLCLDSIEYQGIPEDSYEIIVIDDGSTDNSRDIAVTFRKVVYFRQENQGQSVARNKGIEVARGKFLCFVDSDDVLVNNSICQLLDIAIKNDIDVITYEMVRCTAYEAQKFTTQNDIRVSSVMTGYEFIERYNFNNGPWWYLLRKDVLDDLRFESGRFAEDGMFTMSMLMKVKSIIHTDTKCYCYIVRPSSTVTKRNVSHVAKMADDYYFAYHYMQELISSHREHLSMNGLKRCHSRSLSYIFFMLVRLLYLPRNITNNWYKRLKEEGLLPVCPPYPGLKFELTCLAINKFTLFSILRFILYNYYRIFQK